MPITEITPTELQQLLSGDNPPTFIDVREEGEAAICSIDGATLIPMNSLPQRLQEIPRDRPVVLYCHAGMRSWMVGQWLSEQGYDARSLAGGIDRWAREIEPEMARY
jgi:rhodanese-related sulfurtransferase